MKLKRVRVRLAATIAAAGVGVALLAGCGSDPASVNTTPETLSGAVQSSSSATPTAATTSSGSSTVPAPTSGAAATDDDSSTLTALANCLRSKGIPLDVNEQPDPSNPKYDATAAAKAFTTCSMSIIASATATS